MNCQSQTQYLLFVIFSFICFSRTVYIYNKLTALWYFKYIEYFDTNISTESEPRHCLEMYECKMMDMWILIWIKKTILRWQALQIESVENDTHTYKDNEKKGNEQHKNGKKKVSFMYRLLFDFVLRICHIETSTPRAFYQIISTHTHIYACVPCVCRLNQISHTKHNKKKQRNDIDVCANTKTL